MKTRCFFVFFSVLAPLTLILTGCHNASQAQPTVSKASFGYPGMKLGPGYYAQMKKLGAMNKAGAGKPPQAPPPKS